MTKESIKIVLNNRKARHEYHILETIEAGIALKGTEVKSIRAGRVSLDEAYAKPKGGNILLFNMHIKPWDTAHAYDQHEPRRPRQLLLHKREIRYLIQAVEKKGYTLIPLRLYFKRGKLKVELGLARGKKLYDKRATAAAREAEREIQRAQKHRLITSE